MLGEFWDDTYRLKLEQCCPSETKLELFFAVLILCYRFLGLLLPTFLAGIIHWWYGTITGSPNKNFDCEKFYQSCPNDTFYVYSK